MRKGRGFWAFNHKFGHIYAFLNGKNSVFTEKTKEKEYPTAVAYLTLSENPSPFQRNLYKIFLQKQPKNDTFAPCFKKPKKFTLHVRNRYHSWSTI